jgi:cobalt-zinc-cadmium efflux system protein
MHDHGHHHTPPAASLNRAFLIGIALNVLFVLVEFIAGFFTDSLALISDAGHNLSDVSGLFLSLWAFRLLKIKATENYTYGYRKATVLVSLLNAVILLTAVGGIGFESFHRFFSPRPVEGVAMAWVAGAGIVINSFTALLFFKDKDKDLNIKGAYLHMMMDALVSLGVVVAGVAIYFTQWQWLDPITSLIIMVVIVVSTWGLLKDSLRLSLDGVPPDIDLQKIKSIALSIKDVKDIHHIHVWAISTSQNALTAHLILSDHLKDEEQVAIKKIFKHDLEHLGIQHVTLETETESCKDRIC